MHDPRKKEEEEWVSGFWRRDNCTGEDEQQQEAEKEGGKWNTIKHR